MTPEQIRKEINSAKSIAMNPQAEEFDSEGRSPFIRLCEACLALTYLIEHYQKQQLGEKTNADHQLDTSGHSATESSRPG